MEAALVGRSVSATPSTPAARPFLAINIAVFPVLESTSEISKNSLVSTECELIKSALPMRISSAPIFVRTPCPVIDSKSVTGTNGSPRSRAACVMAEANGCSLWPSALAARDKISFSSKPSKTMRSVSIGFPFVMVPVLSRIIAVIFSEVSRAFADLINIPEVAPFPVPIITDNGVAKPRAHGQAIIKTVTAAMRAYVNVGAGPRIYQAAKTTIEQAMTNGTKTELIKSTKR